jgi:hypothetical protein
MTSKRKMPRLVFLVPSVVWGSGRQGQPARGVVVAAVPLNQNQ